MQHTFLNIHHVSGYRQTLYNYPHLTIRLLLDLAATQKKPITGAEIEAQVSLGRRKGGRFVLEVNLRIYVQGIKLGEAEGGCGRCPSEGCPYSNAVRGNVPVTIAVFKGVAP